MFYSLHRVLIIKTFAMQKIQTRIISKGMQPSIIFDAAIFPISFFFFFFALHTGQQVFSHLGRPSRLNQY